MCSIFGVLGNPHNSIFDQLHELAGDRGRDADGIEVNDIGKIGNCRAIPTTEKSIGRVQPYDGFVHNGTIANDVELGNTDGRIDSEILVDVLDTSSLGAFRDSVLKLKGSYAIAALTEQTIYLACNYKPIYTWEHHGSVYFSSMRRHLEPFSGPFSAPKKMMPYSVMDLRTGESLALLIEPPMRPLVVASSGLDSTVVASKFVHDSVDTALLHFSYGCKATSREYDAIDRIGTALRAKVIHQELQVPQVGNLFGDDDHIAPGVAGAEYAHEWVPARNLIMLAQAVAIAEVEGYTHIALGNNLEEAGAYPDNEEEFFVLLNDCLANATNEGIWVKMIQPVGHLMKHEIVRLGITVDAPLHLTWSCYRDGEKHCGRCGPCFMRRTAFERNGLVDPVAYEN